MARPRRPEPVMLFCGLLSGDADLLRRARQLLARRVGPIGLESDILDFEQTDYYEEEMGADLKRLFVCFDALRNPDILSEVKHETNAIENELAEQCLALDLPRPVNLDPGYIDLGKLVLATTKDRSHRIYIGQHMYAEVTLHYMGGRWKTWPWTYPDYQRQDYHEFFTLVRDWLLAERRRRQAALDGDPV